MDAMAIHSGIVRRSFSVDPPIMMLPRSHQIWCQVKGNSNRIYTATASFKTSNRGDHLVQWRAHSYLRCARFAALLNRCCMDPEDHRQSSVNGSWCSGKLHFRLDFQLLAGCRSWQQPFNSAAGSSVFLFIPHRLGNPH